MSDCGRRHVRVCFGQKPIAAYVGDATHAERYAAAMARRCSSLRITREPLNESGRGHFRSGPAHSSVPERSS